MASSSSSPSADPTSAPVPAANPSSTAAPDASASSSKKKPVVILCIGMAGSGKTTLMQRFNSYLHSKKTPPYVLNLDPAVTHMPFTANIDIRDTVDYKEVMKQYNLGPNGGILTALNLFTTKFDQVLDLVEKRSEEVEYVLIDTPGQIEIFTWSASGSIITDTLASTFPTCVAYIIDTPRTTSPQTFMSNMLYACSILYKTKLPFILVFNKSDVQDCEFAKEWMSDFEAFQDALSKREREGRDGEPGYMLGLMNSMSLVLDEFYKNLNAVGVSAMTGAGMKEFFEAVDGARKEYETDYLPELEKLSQQRAAQKEAHKQEQLAKLMKDMNVQQPAAGSSSDFAKKRGGVRLPGDDDDGIIRRGYSDEKWNPDEEEGEESEESMWGDDSDEGDGIIDRSEEAGPGPGPRSMDITKMGGDALEGMSWPRPQ